MNAVQILLILLSLLFIDAVVCWAPAPYDESIARQLVWYSAIAYSQPAQVQQWKFNNPDCNTNTANFEIKKTFSGVNEDNNPPFAYLGVDHQNKHTIVAFKGTNGTRDAAYDLSSLMQGLMSYPSACGVNDKLSFNAHVGFCSYYQDLNINGVNLREFVFQHYQKYKYPIYVTGHSLGGAAAALFAIDFASSYVTSRVPVYLYTFGEPHVGDFALHGLMLKYQVNGWRVVNNRDAIPHLAPCCSTLGMWPCGTASTCPHHHHGEAFYMNDKLILCDSPEAQNCSDRYLMGLSQQDHLVYFGIRVGRECKLVAPEDMHLYE